MKLRKYNEKKHLYEDYEVPNDWNIKQISYNLLEMVNCCQCGRKIKFKDAYPSMQVHDANGFGYAVCEDCHYNIEILERKKYRKD